MAGKSARREVIAIKLNLVGRQLEENEGERGEKAGEDKEISKHQGKIFGGSSFVVFLFIAPRVP